MCAEHEGKRFSEQLVEAGVQIGWVARACDVRAAADINLAEVRSEAVVDWLKEDIEKVPRGD